MPAVSAARLAPEQLANDEVRETVAPPGPLPYAASDVGSAEALAVALAPGSATVTVTVQVGWALR